MHEWKCHPDGFVTPDTIKGCWEKVEEASNEIHILEYTLNGQRFRPLISLYATQQKDEEVITNQLCSSKPRD